MGRPSVKSQLVERTLEVFLARGYEGASVNELVAAAGVPKGSFYNHFASKEALAVEHVRRYVADLELDALVRDEADPLQAIRDHFDQRIAARAETGLENGCLLGNFSTGVPAEQRELRAAVADGLERWRAAVAVVVVRAQRRQDIDPRVSADDLAGYLVASFEGATAAGRAALSVEPLTAWVRTTFEVLLPRLTPGPAS